MSSFGGGMRGGKGMRGPAGDRGDLDFKLLWRAMGYMKPHRRQRNGLIALTVIRAIQVPAFAWLISYVMHGPIEGGNYHAVVWCGVALAALAVFTQVTFHFRQRWGAEIGEKVVHDLRREIFDKLQRMPMRFYDRTKLGSIISRMVSDVEAMRVGVQDVLFVSVVQLGQTLVAAAIMLYYDPVLFGVVLCMTPILMGMTLYFRPKIGAAWQDVQESFSRLTSRLAEAMTGIRVTQGFVRQEHNAAAFGEQVALHGEMNMRALRLQSVYLPLIELNNQFFIAALLLVGGYQVLVHQGSLVPWWGGDQEATFASLFVFFFMVNMFFGGVAFMARMYNQALTAMAGRSACLRCWTRRSKRCRTTMLRSCRRFGGGSRLRMSALPMCRTSRCCTASVSWLSRAKPLHWSGRRVAGRARSSSSSASFICRPTAA